MKVYFAVLNQKNNILSQLKQDEKIQKEIYDQKSLEKENIAFEILRDRLGFKFCRTLRDLKLFRLLLKLEINKNDKILDVGCFTGHILNRINTEFKTEGYGVDISSNAIKQAKRYQGFNNKYFVSSAYKLPFPNNFFDGALSLDVLEHIENKELFSKELFRVLKPDGWFLIYAVSSNYKYTFNWLRWKIKSPKIDYGFWKEAGHREKFLVNPQKILEISRKFSSKRIIIYSHSFFTLIFDLYISRIFNKVVHSYLRKEKSIKSLTNSLFFKLYLLLFNFSLCFLTFLDKFWTERGLSNGFFLTGLKRNR